MALNGTVLANLILSYGGTIALTPKYIGFCQGIVDEVLTGTVPTKELLAGPHPIEDLDPNAMASFIKTNTAIASIEFQLIQFCTGVCNHILANAEVTYSTKLSPPNQSKYGLNGTIASLDYEAMAISTADLMGLGPATDQFKQVCRGISDHIMNDGIVNDGVIS